MVWLLLLLLLQSSVCCCSKVDVMITSHSFINIGCCADCVRFFISTVEFQFCLLTNGLASLMRAKTPRFGIFQTRKKENKLSSQALLVWLNAGCHFLCYDKMPTTGDHRLF
mmetsp:Transcript_28384/g.77912  ORF Transcript_28384/g.77912 Transcript_28384/m.77912 type:complete len:111 (-) Transcript_28384:488-820(-)